MELLKEILARVLEKEEINIVFPNLNADLTQLVEMKCYNTLKNIRAVIDDETFNDMECFLKIEKIICELEDAGIFGSRHDFG